LHFIMLSVDLDVPTLKEIEDDERFLEERLKDGSNSTWKEYLWRRLGDSQLLGGELDGVEVPNVIDPLKPKLLKYVGGGASGVVYESIWLGFKCATKILPIPDDAKDMVCKEATKILPIPDDAKDMLCKEATKILPIPDDAKDMLCKEATKILPVPDDAKDMLCKEATKILPVPDDAKDMLCKEATKILPTLQDISKVIRKEVGILAGLSHPNVIKFIYCGIGWSMDELCSWTLKVSRKWQMPKSSTIVFGDGVHGYELE
jgi:serine/threonine protein kinase